MKAWDAKLQGLTFPKKMAAWPPNSDDHKEKDTRMYTRNTTRTTSLAGLALTALAGAALPALASTSAPQAGKADAVLTQKMGARTGTVSAIVKTAGTLTAAQEARVAALGGTITARLPIIGSVTVSLPTGSLARLAALPFVTHLSYDGQVQKCDAFTVANSGAGAAFQQYGLDGTGVGVAVIDSGVHVTPDLDTISGKGGTSHRVYGTFNAVPYAGTTYNGVTIASLPQNPIPYDLCGHGTHVAGIIAGNGAWSKVSGCTQTFYGIARDANIVNVRVFDEHGAGSVSNVVPASSGWSPTRAAFKIKVINLSLGSPSR